METSDIITIVFFVGGIILSVLKKKDGKPAAKASSQPEFPVFDPEEEEEVEDGASFVETPVDEGEHKPVYEFPSFSGTSFVEGETSFPASSDPAGEIIAPGGQPQEKHSGIDGLKLVIYSEIMKPKWQEFQ